MSGLRRLFSFGEQNSSQNLRIIITRHGERVDLVLGPKWATRMQREGVRDPRIPRHLPRRQHFHDWEYDPPLTVDGERQSTHIGKKLLRLGYPIDYCYASPSYRAIQTADKILEGQGRKAVPISIEPGLFECPAWYTDGPLLFIPPNELAHNSHFNIDSTYAPIFDRVDETEDERRYYRRSRRLIDAIVKAHKKVGGTILLSGHAGSIEALSRGMLHRGARPERLRYEANKVDYCNFAILERDARSRQWSVRTPESLTGGFGYAQQNSIQTTIPIYRATTKHLPSRYPTQKRRPMMVPRHLSQKTFARSGYYRGFG